MREARSARRCKRWDLTLSRMSWSGRARSISRRTSISQHSGMPPCGRARACWARSRNANSCASWASRPAPPCSRPRREPALPRSTRRSRGSPRRARAAWANCSRSSHSPIQNLARCRDLGSVRRIRRTPRPAGDQVATSFALADSARPARRLVSFRVAGWLWSGLLLALLAFLVLYPTFMLLYGALSGTNPVVDGFDPSAISLDNFIEVLANPNVHFALVNTLLVCGGGTAIAVVVWTILGSPRTGLINTMLAWLGVDWRLNFYSMPGLIAVFGMYYAPYVYMFTSAALRNMDPSLEEAAEISGASAVGTLRTITFPLIAPAIIAATLLSFIVVLGIYGIPAVLGAPANISVLTTYIFNLTAWSPPLYSTAAAVAILLMIVTGLLVVLQQMVLSGKSFTTVAGKAFRPRSLDLGRWRYFTLALAIVYLLVVAVLPTLALVIAAFRKYLFFRRGEP